MFNLEKTVDDLYFEKFPEAEELFYFGVSSFSELKEALNAAIDRGTPLTLDERISLGVNMPKFRKDEIR